MDLLNLIKKKSSPLKKLELAVLENNNKELKEVLENGVDPNVEIQYHGGNCALHIAAQNGYFLCVETLLEYNADPDKTNHFNLTPLYIALRRNHARCVEILLRINKPLLSIEPVWMNMDNAARVWNDAKDTMISVLIKATPDLERCRSNLRSNLFFLCKNKMMYTSLHAMYMGGYSLGPEQIQMFMNSHLESDKNFYDWVHKFNRQPQGLMHYCRLSVRRSFCGNCNVYYGVQKLPLPRLVKDYIILKDINGIDT